MHQWLDCKFLLFKGEKYVLKSLNKIRPQSPEKNLVDTYGAPVFEPDNSATGLAANM